MSIPSSSATTLISTQQSSSFWATTDGNGNIMFHDGISYQQAGVTIEKYRQLEASAKEALEKAEGYYKQLVDAGLIIPPKTQEEQLAELAAHCAKQDEQIAEQNSRILQLMELLTQERSHGHSLNSPCSTSNEQSDTPKGRDGSKVGRTIPAN